MKKLRLRKKFVITISVTILLTSVCYLIWFVRAQKVQMEQELLVKAQVMTREMDAVWEFMELNQHRINYTSEGKYEFKGLYCSIVGKSIGTLFSRDYDYVFHYTSLNYRNKLDKPDAFETEALRYLTAEPGQNEYYEITEYNGEEVFRYARELMIKESCLECHGEPAGSVDKTGYRREGLRLGDTGGAISIIIPVNMLMNNLQENLRNGMIFFGLLMVIISLVLYFSISYLVVGPLNGLQKAVKKMKETDSPVRIHEKQTSGEMQELVNSFNEMAEELQDFYENLEQQVEDRTAELKKENQAKSDFLAVMTHELRTPLTAILGFTEILLNMDGKSEKERDLLERVRTNSVSLLNTVNNTLNLYRLEISEGDLDLDWLDIVDVAGAVENQMLPIFRKKRIRWRLKIERDVEPFLGDADMIFHILENLLSNAAKFTPEEGEIEMWVSQDKEACEVVIRVKDNGIGIAPEHQELIFDKFTQSDKTISRQYGGSGLGLTLVKKWTELHRGKVLVESEPGRGSTFIVRIPSNLKRPGKEENRNESDAGGR